MLHLSLGAAVFNLRVEAAHPAYGVGHLEQPDERSAALRPVAAG